MSDLTLGALYGAVTLVVMFSGMPIAFALGVVATGFMYFFMPASSLDTVTQNVYEEMASITLLSIPLFILKGAAIGKSPAGKDLYSAIHTWLHKVPGGLGIANVFACALFAAMAGSSPATCSAIGSAGIPEMRKRGYSPGFAAGIIAAGGTLGILLPPSITMILYAVAAEQSLGRLFLAGIGPGLLLVGLFAGYAVYRARKEYAMALALYEGGGAKSAYLETEHFTLREKVEMLPRVLPFIILLIGVMVALYGGYATPSETAGLGALAGAGADRRGLPGLAAEGPGADPHLDHQGIDHAAADHRHVAVLLLRDELPAHQPVGRAVGGRHAPVALAAAGGDPADGDRASASSCRRCRSS